jgi:diguanylate cyclase (GGDEF)-like protein
MVDFSNGSWNKKTKVTWTGFIISVTLLIMIFTVGIFLGIYWRDKQLLLEETANRARAHFRDIVLTRRWNAKHGGVYVLKSPGVQSNPYLDDPDIVAKDGRIYTKKNPALMTREISALANDEGLFKYHITSLKPLNPDNKADPFEQTALASFEKGVKETSAVVLSNSGAATFRYMAPLLVEKTCMPCHAKQGYKVGEVRGGISVSFPITNIQNAIRTNQYMVVLLIVLSAGFLLGLIYFFIFRMMNKLEAAHARIQQLAITDDLTAIANRRHFLDIFQQEAARNHRYLRGYALILIDLDHFKKINDNHGHAAGDQVLKEVASLLSGNVREVDTVARYGGEEFVILLPDTGADGAAATAEKLRLLVAGLSFDAADGGKFQVTMSAGVAAVVSGGEAADAGIDGVLKAADRALYRAKDKGRNRLEVAV